MAIAVFAAVPAIGTATARPAVTTPRADSGWGDGGHSGSATSTFPLPPGQAG
ncbi:hypothetical protein [Kitasatospora acidiphila]|uniref:hypothetical protein n=1 Tax=Kitasatospora acidiphila TaxID=2567942 RepID=UPI003C72231E